MEKKDKKEEKESLLTRVITFVKNLIYFITYDIWRITASEVSGLKVVYINAIKTVILASRGFINDKLSTKASALTYSTFLAIVPLLAVVVGVAAGFHLDDVVKNELVNMFPGHKDQLDYGFDFATSYLKQAKGGVILGVGLALLLYTVINLLMNVEDTFNEIWQVKKTRPLYRKLIDYLAMIIILPVLMTFSGGISIFISTLNNSFLSDYFLFTPIMNVILSVAPYIITSLVFAALYIALPNTKVHISNGLIAGVIAGSAFQFFQFIYISGQIWVSKYNAIYGGFAAIPLLLLWLQISWIICLFGAQLAFSSQNVEKFSFERDSKNISRRYYDFLIMLIMSLIIKRFETDEKPYTSNELSYTYRIPIRLTSKIIFQLQELGLINELHLNEEREARFQPAVDINKISVASLFQKLEETGSENFKIDITDQFKSEWETFLKSREDMYKENQNILLKDL